MDVAGPDVSPTSAGPIGMHTGILPPEAGFDAWTTVDDEIDFEMSRAHVDIYIHDWMPAAADAQPTPATSVCTTPWFTLNNPDRMATPSVRRRLAFHGAMGKRVDDTTWQNTGFCMIRKRCVIHVRRFEAFVQVGSRNHNKTSKETKAQATV